MSIAEQCTNIFKAMSHQLQDVGIKSCLPWLNFVINLILHRFNFGQILRIVDNNITLLYFRVVLFKESL